MMAAKPKVTVRTVEAWFVGDEIHVDRDGSVSVYMSAQDASEAIKRDDERAAKRGAMVVTVIEWRNTPDGFEPPR